MEKTITTSTVISSKKESLINGITENTIFNENNKIRTLIQKFKAFCERQNENRLGWTAVIIAAQVFLLVPITLIAVASNGVGFVFFIPVILSSFVTVVSNLAALPTKITIPVFCASVLINVSVIMLSFMF